VPGPSGSKTLGNIRPVYANDQAEEKDQTASNPGVDPPPHAPNKWDMRSQSGFRYGRDPYANNGTDQYLQNPSN
jgi:hypothetical protein